MMIRDTADALAIVVLSAGAFSSLIVSGRVIRSSTPAPVEPPAALVHVGGYRTAPLARVSPAPRRGLRGVAYLGNELALRVRSTPLPRLLWAWCRGAVIRVWHRNRTEWRGVCSAIAPQWHWFERRRVTAGTSSGGLG